MSPLPSYLRTHRKRWALTQRELGTLLGLSPSAITKYESKTRQPPVEVVLGCEFIFDAKPEAIFKALVASIRATILLNAKSLQEHLKDESEPATKRKLSLLDSLIARAEAEPDV